MYQEKERRFIRYNLYAIISLFLVILAGGVVRSSGAGMGCPDWPKCFDHYIPPTDVSQLPENYQEKYVVKRLEKNLRFATMLEKLGYNDLADKVRHDETIKIPEEFNVTKTYTEYVNRLVGAVSGVFLLLTCFFSVYYLKKSKRIFVLSFFNLLLIVFQAWLGSIVVSTNLLAWTITVHMVVAVIIIGIAVYTYYHAKYLLNKSIQANNTNTWLSVLVFLALILSVFQIIIGTEVRESIDAIIQSFPSLARNEWLNKLGDIYLYHKVIAIVVVVLSVIIVLLINSYSKKVFKQGLVLIVIVGIQYITGLMLHHLGMPPVAQALHVLFATIMFSMQLYLLLLLRPLNK